MSIFQTTNWLSNKILHKIKTGLVHKRHCTMWSIYHVINMYIYAYIFQICHILDNTCRYFLYICIQKFQVLVTCIIFRWKAVYFWNNMCSQHMNYCKMVQTQWKILNPVLSGNYFIVQCIADCLVSLCSRIKLTLCWFEKFLSKK